MTFSHLCVVRDRDRQGGLLPLVVGQPNDHLMDWNGCNFHQVQLPGWRRGRRLPDTPRNLAVLKALLRAVDHAAVKRRVLDMSGQFFSDHGRYDDSTGSLYT